MIVAILVLVFVVIATIVLPVRNYMPESARAIYDMAYPVLYAALGILIALKGYFFLKATFATGKAGKKCEEEEPDADEEDGASACLPDQERLARFFLSLYKAQLGAKPSDTAQARRVDKDSRGKTFTYELRVKSGQDWQTRRMRVSPLGEGSGSKSKCFYVIYDDHMVVKIPPTPITEFDKYVASIKKEVAIQEQVAPRECIVPRVSVILRKIYSFDDEKFLTPAQMEEKYLKWLRGSKFQRYLKINGAFAFFMDLSRYYFLGGIVEEMHAVEDRVEKEIASQGDVFFDLEAYTGRYGEANRDAGEAVLKMVQELGKALIAAHRDASQPPPSEYDIRRWFSAHLSGGKVKKGDQGVEPSMVQAINQTMATSLEAGAEAMEMHREAVRAHFGKLTFNQNKPRMEAICVNLVELLAHLAEKKVAIRDLKPDNLLVAGDQKEYPAFLNNANRFKIGLIDVETAVIFKPIASGKIVQPMLGGTPYFATPSHLMGNDILAKLYESVPHVLHMQDWQATTGMIFRIIMGQHLFFRSGRTLPVVGKALQVAARDKKDLVAVCRMLNRKFFEAASREFGYKLEKNEAMLKQVNLAFPENARNLLRNELAEVSRGTDVAVETLVAGQKIYNSDKNRQILLSADARAVRAKREKLAGGLADSTEKLADNAEAVKLLKELEALKAKQEKQRALVLRLEDPSTTLTAYETLDAMFGVVHGSLCPSEWGLSCQSGD